MNGKRLIVNADDYNTDGDRNRGIIEAARNGIVSSVSVLTNLPWHDNAQQDLTASFNNNIGIHLNLTKGLPLTKGARTLTDQTGRFFSKLRAWRKALLGSYCTGEIRMEFEAQINRLIRAGIMPDHIDGNNHIHVFPGIAAVTAGLAVQFGIPCIRLPREPLHSAARLVRAGGCKKLMFLMLCRSARKIFLRAGLRFPDRTAGIQQPRVWDVPELRQFLRTLPDGTTELMCHPGYAANNGNPFSTPRRQEELTALTNAEVMQDVEKYGIIICSYSTLKDTRNP